jgi:hypothetical protein
VRDIIHTCSAVVDRNIRIRYRYQDALLGLLLTHTHSRLLAPTHDTCLISTISRRPFPLSSSARAAERWRLVAALI